MKMQLHGFNAARAVLLGLCFEAAAVPQNTPTPMNAVEYKISNPAAPNVRPAFHGESFEIYGPWIKTRYSEVHWSSAPIDLPQEIVERFDGRVMAITGFESDVVRQSADGSEEIVPCYEQYNHHYSSYMHGKRATLIKASQEILPEETPSNLKADSHYVHLPKFDVEDGQFPAIQVFSEGNGNEHRASFKGAPHGYAQLIESPVKFLSGPMMINTNKRLTNDTSPGPINNELLPRNSIAPPGADYSGIAECPCTSRKPKIFESYVVKSSASCGIEAVESPDECAAAWVKATGQNVTGSLAQVHSDVYPPGCSGSAGQVRFNFGGRVSTPCDGLTCICRDPDSKSGTLFGRQFKSPAAYCAPYPTSELLTTNNSICDLRYYNGGLQCCSGGTLLLDADQEVPSAVDTWRMKYRFYFEEYSSQVNTFRVWWSTEATNNEYDVPKSNANCLDPSTPEKQCEHVIRSKFRGVDVFGGSGCMSSDPNSCGNVTRINEDGGKFQLMYAGPHCHAPACKSMELWNEDTGELLCNVSAVYYGAARCVLELPPCLWGSEGEGLKAPPVLHLDSNLTIVKRTNNTNGHWGTMALWQMRGSYLPRGGDKAPITLV